MFPGAGASISYNEAGEPVSWDYPQYDEGPDPDDFDEDGDSDWAVCNECGNEYESGDPGIERHIADTGHNRWS